ncbi:hypothetical protein R1flu_005794 [Riccia fluitans]|uniref:Uncharacterized protein n=1 Tax=Riccia fluitans TaxID=41844 RepID=A0ABD1YUZ6_9MARC
MNATAAKDVTDSMVPSDVGDGAGVAAKDARSISCARAKFFCEALAITMAKLMNINNLQENVDILVGSSGYRQTP